MAVMSRKSKNLTRYANVKNTLLGCFIKILPVLLIVCTFIICLRVGFMLGKVIANGQEPPFDIESQLEMQLTQTKLRPRRTLWNRNRGR